MQALIKKGVFAIGFAIVAMPAVASAGLFAYNDYAVLSSDRTRVLVMVSPLLEPRTLDPGVINLPAGRTVSIQKTFAKSGVYDTKTLEPIWRVDWYAIDGELRWSADFSHLVRLNYYGFHRSGGLTFYHDGKLIKQYEADDLLTDLKSAYFLPYETFGWYTRWHEDFDLRGDVLFISTPRRVSGVLGYPIDFGRQEFYTFDLKSGAMLSRQVGGQWVIWLYILGILFLIAAPLVVLLLHGRRKRQLAISSQQ